MFSNCFNWVFSCDVFIGAVIARFSVGVEDMLLITISQKLRDHVRMNDSLRGYFNFLSCRKLLFTFVPKPAFSVAVFIISNTNEKRMSYSKRSAFFSIRIYISMNGPLSLYCFGHIHYLRHFGAAEYSVVIAQH